MVQKTFNFCIVLGFEGFISFISYIAPVSEVAQRNEISDQKYADDDQLILSFKPTFLGKENAVGKMEKCANEKRDFLHDNKQNMD